MKELDEAEKLAFVRRATREMASYTFPYVSTVTRVEGESGAAVGSSVRVCHGGRRWIVTAAHVVTAARATAGRMAVTGTRGEAPIELTGEPRKNVEADICAFPAPAGYPDVGFWNLEERDEVDASLSRDFLFIHGFPQTRAYFSPNLRGLMTKSLPYGAMRREDSLPQDIAPHQFAIEFEAKMFQSVDAEVVPFEWPHGLSGSPVWRIGAAGGRASEWSPANCRLVGLLTQWRPKEELLVATRIARLAALLGRP